MNSNPEPSAPLGANETLEKKLDAARRAISSFAKITTQELWKEFVEPTTYQQFRARLRTLLVSDISSIIVGTPLDDLPEEAVIGERDYNRFHEVSTLDGFIRYMAVQLAYIRSDSSRDEVEKEMVDATFPIWESFLHRVRLLAPNLINSIREVYSEAMLWLHKHPDQIEAVAWDAFEKIVAEIFASNGFTVDLTGRDRNRSADIVAVRTDEFGVQTKYLVEIKHYREDRRIGLDVVNAVIGAKERAKVEHAFLVTTSSFTEDVERMKAELGEFRLHLFDGEKVKEWLRDYTVRSDGGIWLEKGWDDK